MSKDNDRELITTIILSNGEKCQIRMPMIGDLLDNPGKPPLEVLIPAAIDMSWERFKKLPVPDGTAILTKLSDAIEAITAYNAGFEAKKLN